MSTPLSSKRGPKTGAATISNRTLDLGSPTPPGFLLPEARAYWDHTVDTLERCGLTGELDSILLALLCNELVSYDEAAAKVRTEGAVTISTKGTEQKSVWLRRLEGSRDAILSMLTACGMSPASRRAFRKELFDNQAVRRFADATDVVSLVRCGGGDDVRG